VKLTLTQWIRLTLDSMALGCAGIRMEERPSRGWRESEASAQPSVGTDAGFWLNVTGYASVWDHLLLY